MVMMLAFLDQDIAAVIQADRALLLRRDGYTGHRLVDDLRKGRVLHCAKDKHPGD